MADMRAGGISERDVWPGNSSAVFRFSTETWMEQRQILAATISAREYFDLADAAHGIDVGAAMVNAAPCRTDHRRGEDHAGEHERQPHDRA
jgi:hypothetical protein